MDAVGNDIVDLTDPSTAGKHGDPRFLGRILDDTEQAALARADDPAVALWRFWAAKEAAYKVASKLRGTPPVFDHAAFSVAWASADGERWLGRVAYQELEIPVEAREVGGAVHAVAAFGQAPGSVRWSAERLGVERGEWGLRLPGLLHRFTPREADAVHSYPSAEVRLRARSALAESLDADERDVEIVCDPGVTGRRPPRALLAGRPASCDVSLSHHGNWVAWAILPQNPVGR